MSKRLFKTGLTLSLLALAACTGKTPPSQFYLLEPVSLAEPAKTNVVVGKSLIALVPVRIPDYLDRPQLVTAIGHNTYFLDELHRWAESLDHNMTRVMQQNLANLIPADVVPTIHDRARQAQLRLSVSVLEFYVDSHQQARLVAQWQVDKQGKALFSRRSAYEIEVGGEQAEYTVQALNQCWNQFSRDIAQAISSLLF